MHAKDAEIQMLRLKLSQSWCK